MSKKIPDIPVPLTVHDLARWCSDLGVPNATVDAVIGKAPGSFKKYLEGINRMKHDDFVTLQDWLRTRADALRKA